MHDPGPAGAGAQRLRFLLTVDDPGGLIRDLAAWHRVQQFLAAEEVPATFFVVPRGDEGAWRLDRDPEWLAAVRDAEARGHDCQLHGLDHQGPEFGPFVRCIYALGGPSYEAQMEADARQFGHLWRRDAFVAKLQTAVEIFSGAFGRAPLAFRSGALSQCPALYDALADVGIRYTSNLITDPRGWAYIIGQYDNPGDWDPAVPPAPYHLTESVVNLPIISEYAWEITPAKVEKHLALGIEDLSRVYQAGGVFLLVCHVQMVGAEEPYSRQVLHRLLEVARTRYQAQFQTVAGLVADIERGAVPVLDRPADAN
ncbi:MAG: DUF2334 domain-containing protein [Armatimonadetes bacterium]|jgi:peptidoglycan/xylan/chitin deacetylase (PgdA/CDA1 family)|nr:DUF2334 domain-containing protein [Armatimonadota bacterium]